MTGEKSYAPRMSVYPTPGRSLARPPVTKTRLYFEQMYPIPGIRAVTRKPLVKATFATCLTAEFGFLGDIVVTLVTIPLTCGRFCKAGVRDS
jgi:hypothetical protein